MARPEGLVVGNCYFSIGFYDDDLLPTIGACAVAAGQDPRYDANQCREGGPRSA
jgi:hypothetical protein